MAELDPAWIGLIGVAAGSIISTIGTLLVVRANVGSAEAQRAHEQKLERERRRNDERRAQETYQVETLLELQIALQQFARSTGAAHVSDAVNHRETGQRWGSQQLPEHWSNVLLESGTAVRLVNARVADRATRDAVERAHADFSVVINATNHADALARLDKAVDAMQVAQDRIGEMLRVLPPPSTYRPIISSPFVEPGGSG